MAELPLKLGAPTYHPVRIARMMTYITHTRAHGGGGGSVHTQHAHHAHARVRLRFRRVWTWARRHRDCYSMRPHPQVTPTKRTQPRSTPLSDPPATRTRAGSPAQWQSTVVSTFPDPPSPPAKPRNPNHKSHEKRGHAFYSVCETCFGWAPEHAPPLATYRLLRGANKK